MSTTTKLDTLNINVMTQAQYKALGSKDPNQLYFVTDSEEFKKLSQLHTNDSATGLTVGSSTNVIDDTLTVDYKLNCNKEIEFENGEQTTEASIRFKNENGTNKHDTQLFGGDPTSATSFGIWDTLYNHRILTYQDAKNQILIGEEGDLIKIQDSTLADFVIKHDTSDGWTYRLWASGIAEAWKKGTKSNVAVTKNIGSGTVLYRSDSIGFDYPNIFTSITYSSHAVQGSSTYVWAGQSATEKSIIIFGYVSTTIPTVTISSYLVGKWK